MPGSDLPIPEDSHARIVPPSLPRDGGGEFTRCWAQVGVYGDSSCPELAKFIHCRNCTVYLAGALELLNRPLPAEYRRDASQHIALEKRTPQGSTMSAVLFRLQSEWLALPTHSLQEVAERRLIHSLPHRQRGVVLGLSNIRGELVICISLGHLLEMERVSPRESLCARYRRLLALNWEGERVAFPVDEVHGPHRFHPQDSTPPPATVGKSNLNYTQRLFYWEKRAISLLDPSLLFAALRHRLT
jgi:chemotaxis-related protein WspD